ncbi:response regulator transcription factor [Alkalibacillus salilacus]|uniref:DNA-binding response OmpR family regulator n=1 Tax=Alkalibacillus salilacus TaxID=284582 RepID=A0ABT9VGK2_9BACI|nr:response regulator transcription factor [Alkalibacillus salilacus]MDQ0160039.1 DNA-binding response OmpR family regulator [Alkalibacillus salilacus]
MTHILVVEDEAKIARVLQLELEFEGYGITTVSAGYDALEIMRDETFDLILLDIMLPEMSGLDILKRYRKHNQTTPVIMLTAKDTVEDKVTGLDSGAQDYVTKPFQIEELLARIRAHLRSTEVKDDGDWLNFPPLHLNVSTRDVIRANRTIELTPKEFDLLVLFLRHPRQVLSREQILNAVWGYDFVGDTNVVDVYVRYLRKKVDHEDESPLIHTVRGVGYVLKDPYETT